MSEFCIEAEKTDADVFPVLYSKGADGQATIEATPDAWYKPRNRESGKCLRGVHNLRVKAGYLLVTSGQNSATARLTAVASDTKYVGGGWMPVAGLSSEAAKALAIFLNSTAGRLQIMRNAGRTMAFPVYSPAGYANIRLPNVEDERICDILADCWEDTKDMEVPQYRDGECEVRRIWDEAVAEAMGWDVDELAHLRGLLHMEPHVRGLGRNQFSD